MLHIQICLLKIMGIHLNTLELHWARPWSQGPSSKRTREQEVMSPHKKASAGSVGESLHTMAHSLKTIQ